MTCNTFSYILVFSLKTIKFFIFANCFEVAILSMLVKWWKSH